MSQSVKFMVSAAAANAAPVTTLKTDCLVLGSFRDGKLTRDAADADQASGGRLTRLFKNGDFNGGGGQTATLDDIHGCAATRIVLVGLGAADKLDDRTYRKALTAAFTALGKLGAKTAIVNLTKVSVPKRDAAWNLQQAVNCARDAWYRFEMHKSKKAAARAIHTVTLMADAKRINKKQCTRAMDAALATANGKALTKDLGNTPPNICTPSYLAEQARALAQTFKSLKCTVLDEKTMRKLGLNTLLSVSAGSAQPPQLITLEHRGGGASQKPVVLVGKGVTFDTGGISIKPAAAMDEMKYDMSGAGSVLGVMRAVAELSLKRNVVGVIPTVENMPGGRATRPGDVVKSLSGQTVEILNTDAEGRLILCDAITYAERTFQPEVVIDIATLTGACVIALGSHAAGLFSNHQPLAKALLKAGEVSGDRAWQMPVWEDYQQQLDSNFADMANIGGREAGAITAACFLARFTRKLKWAHLDVAGTAYRGGTKTKGATGRPVPLLLEYLLSL